MVLGLFDTQEEAGQARRTLETAGIPSTQMSLTQHNGTAAADETWWDRLKTMFGLGVHSEDLPYYKEGLRRGGTLLSVQTAEAKEEEVAGILADHNAVDIDTRASEWKSGGWSPDEQITIPVVEEELAIGKRLVRRGGVRIYTSVTESPVEETVTLREEHVQVTRRPANRAATPSDLSASETPIEITETAEEPIVSKQAKVVEEVVVNKTDTERTKTLRDTVRRKDVDIKQAS